MTLWATTEVLYILTLSSLKLNPGGDASMKTVKFPEKVRAVAGVEFVKFRHPIPYVKLPSPVKLNLI